MQIGNKITPKDNINESMLGEAVAISDDGKTLVAGGRQDYPSGAVSIYIYDGSKWVQQAKLVPLGGSIGFFGVR